MKNLIILLSIFILLLSSFIFLKKIENCIDFEKLNNNSFFNLNEFDFKNIIQKDLNSDGEISKNEKIKEATIISENNNNFLQIRFKNNSFSKSKQGKKKGGYGNYLNRAELMFSENFSTGDEVLLKYKLNLKQFLTENSCYKENRDIISQFLIRAPIPKDLDTLIRKPVLALAIVKNEWKVLYTDFSTQTRENCVINSAVEKNKWINVTIKFKLSNKNDGYIKILFDDEIVFEKNNYANSPRVGLKYSVKCGVYKPSINVCKKTVMKPNMPDTDRIIWFDDLCLKINK
jgi:hypothetical protein